MVIEMKYGDLTGQIAVVTGGGRGIGEAICRILAEYGATAVIADINPEMAESAAAALRQEGLSPPLSRWTWGPPLPSPPWWSGS